tara:strand:+ start:4018 stop:4476 length:459 start_codon:yes stop_codon:yes gene_type:complete
MATHRGFQDGFYHDEQIVDNWNNVVNKKDVTYILGDVTMEKRTNYEILDRLAGIKIVVMGNHDMKNHARSLLEHVDHVAGCIGIRVSGKKIMLSHIPVHPMEFDYRLDYNIHGHIHDLVVKDKDNKPDNRYKCVSMEQIGYTPRELSELIKL